MKTTQKGQRKITEGDKRPQGRETKQNAFTSDDILRSGMHFRAQVTRI